MKRSNFLKRALSVLMCLLMVAGLFTMSVAAYDEDFVSETHDVFSRKTSTIAPGVTQDIVYAYSKDGKQMAYYVATADVNRDDVAVYANYMDNQCEEFGMSKLTEQMAAAQERNTTDTTAPNYNPYYTAVAGVNADFYNMSTGQPSGAFVMEGVMASNKANNRPFFAIFEDGYAYCGANNSAWDALVKEHGAVVEAVGGSQMLLRDGADVTATVSGSYNTDRHCRSAVGVTADGQIVMMSLDGRQEPFSCGGSMHEIAQIMLEAGCVTAINLDGGGSTTFAARQEGENEVTIVNRPSDGAERAISSSLMIVSTAAPSDVFDRAILTAENEYVTPYSTVNVTAAGVSPAGTAAEIPESAAWQLEDASMGTVADGVFTSNGTTGTAVVQLVVDGAVVGETTINVVIPDLAFDSASMTVPYNKTFKLEVSGTTNNGLNKVVLKDSDLVFTLSDSKMGTIDGAYYTTCDDASGVKGGTITVKCAYDATKTATATVSFGKASVIAEDFEDGNITGWSAKSAYATAGKGDVTYGRFESYDLNLVDAETGKVRNGNYALEIVADFTTTTRAGYKAIKYSFPAINLAGATTFGMWMYLPVQDVHNLEFDIGGYEYYIEDDANISEEGWYYVTAPAATVGSTVSTFTIYMTDPDQTYTNIFNKYSIYVDDLTIDYSNATEDREIPEFTKVNVVTGLDAETAVNGQTLTTATNTFKAYAAENTTGNYTGLNTNTACVYVDGVKLDDSKFTCDEKGIITVGDLTLSNGTHTLRFEIDDKAGNTGFVTKQIVINEENGDVYVARRSNAAQPLTGSVEYFDVVANNIENVDEITLTIDLDNVNIWELEGADVAYGFTMDYTVDESFNTAYITITKTGEPVLTGEAVIAALPVRVWMTTSYLNPAYIAAGVVTDNPSATENTHIFTPAAIWATDGPRLVEIEFRVLSGIVDYADGKNDTFSGKEIDVLTENNRYRSAGYYKTDGTYVTGNVEFCKQGKESTHLHTEVALDDKDATCTETGYTDRTYCEVCASVVEWGTIIPAAGHTYEVIDGVYMCADCDELFSGEADGVLYVDGIAAEGWVDNSYYVAGVALTGVQLIDGIYYDFGDNGVSTGKYTGFVELEDGWYYVAMGNIAKGWMYIDGAYHYFDPTTGLAYHGKDYWIYNESYKFDEKGKLLSGVWAVRPEGTRYYYGPAYYYRTWADIDGKTYYFDVNGYTKSGICNFIAGMNGDTCFYEFDENGALIRAFDETGLYAHEGNLYYLENGVCQSGLYYVDGYYYYFRSGSYVAASGRYWVSDTNGLDVEPGYYDFDETTFKMIRQEDKNGLIKESDGKTYFYVNGVKTYAGLVKDDEGNFYYINSNLSAVTGKYWVEKNNGLLPKGYYTFDENGIYRQKNGLVTEADGKTYYYVDDVRTYAGLVQAEDGSYYYINSNLSAVTGRYWVEKNNDLLPKGYYNFGTDGKLTVKNGLITEADGKTYYYVNGQQTYAGLVKDDEGNFYYINSNLSAVTGKYWVEKNNDLLPKGYYTFDENGKYSPKNGILVESTGTHYYVDGIKTYAGLVKDANGTYYYFNSTLKAVTGKYWVEKNNDLLPKGYYNFDSEGKMIVG